MGLDTQKQEAATGNGLLEKQDNVLDLKHDEKLKLQLEIRKMVDDLKSDVNAKKQTQELENSFRNLLFKTKISVQEYNSTKQKIENLYTEAKGGDQSATIKKMQDEIDHQLARDFVTIDDSVEIYYNSWIKTVNKNQSINALEISFSQEVSRIVRQVNEALLNQEELQRMTYRFELKNLKAEILNRQSGTTWDPLRHPTMGGRNPSINGEVSGSQNNNGGEIMDEELDIPDYRGLYIGKYANSNKPIDNGRYFSDADKPGKTYNIYKDNQMSSVMDKILDSEDKDLFKKRSFGVNLSLDSGFAGILDTIANNPGKRMSIGKGNNIYEFVIDPKTEQIKLVSTPEGKRTDGKITDKDLKAMVKSGLLKYEHEKGSILNPQLDNEFAKMAKIMNQAKWADLSTFVALSKSRSKQSSALKEYVNAKENKDLCQAETVFDFLCDRNGDGLVTGSSQERVKGEKNQKDIGNIFGPQLKWSIDQAAAIIDAKYPAEKTIKKTTYGERIVIQNIMLNIDLQDSRFADIVSKSQKSSDLYKEFAIYRDLNSCTRENLAASVRAYPEFKVFFGAAIEKINGSPDVLAPDLMDSLTGNVIDRFLEQGDWKFRANLEKKIDKAILDKFGTTVIESQRIKLRENLLSQIMNVADGFTIIGSDSKEGYLKNPGITKEFANKEAKQAFINSLTTQTLSSFALGALRGENSIRIPVDFIKQGHSENGRTIWKVQAGPSIGYDWEENGILLTLGVGGEVAEQYNYKKVINANLDHVKDAKYIGAEGRAIAGTSLNELTIGAEASVGLMRQKDPIMGINQINRQYEHVSKELFRIPSDAKVSTAEDIYNIIKTNISNTNDSYKDFVKNNEKRLLANADFIASFLDAYKVVSLTQSNPSAINALISMLQEGNMEQWRSDLLNNLHGTFDITKLSFGVTTNMLTIACKNNETRPGMTDQNLGADTELNAITGNDKGKSIKLGLFGFYVGARIANWKTSYGVNSQQLAKTRYDIAEGKNTDKYNPKDIAEYAKYLKALFNQEGLSFTPMNGILRISQDKKSPIKIPDLLNIRVTDIAESSVKYNSDEDILDIGNVLEIGAYTTARPDGVVRQLILGSKKYKDGHPLDNWSTAGNTPDVIGTIDGDKYEAVTKADIENKLAKPEYFRGEERSIFLNCFGANGQLDKAAMKANNVEFVADKSSNDVISAGKIIVFRKTGDTYTLSVEPSTIEAGLSLRVINGNYINGQRISFEKTAKTSVNFVPESINKTLKPLFDEIDASKYPNLEIANKQTYIDDFMNGTTIDAQVATLKTLLKNKPDFATILTELNKADITNEAKIYIVNQFKGIFAYSAGYPNMKIAEIYNARTKSKETSDINKYPFLKAFKNLPLPENVQKDIITERARIQNIQTKYKRTDRSSVNNLFGYTAFYKTKAGVDPTADLVSGGDTKVMKIGSDETFRLAHQDEAKEWISRKLNSEPTEKSMIWEGILKNITDTGMKDILSKLSGTDKDTLIKTGELSIDNGLKKITLDAEAVFYFKAECMNESIGLKVRDISIAEAPVNDVTITKEQILATQVHMSSQSVAGNAKAQKKEVGAQGYVSKASLGIHGKAQNNSTNPGMTDQNLDTNTEL